MHLFVHVIMAELAAFQFDVHTALYFQNGRIINDKLVSSQVNFPFIFCLFPAWGRRIEFSIYIISYPVLCFFSRYSFLVHVFSYNITPPQFRTSYISVFKSIFQVRIFFSLSLHMA